MTDSKPAKTRPLRLILALVAMGLVLVAALTWLNRRTLAREALTGWLKSRGVASDVAVEGLGFNSFAARLRIGDPRRPDFVAERAEVRFRPTLTGVELVSVTLTKPVLRAAYRGGRLDLGSLDPLVQEFLSRPTPPDAKLPRFQIDGGTLALSTDYGPVRTTGDLLFDDNRLQTLTAATAPTRLKGQGFDVATGPGRLRATTRNDRVDLSLSVPVSQAVTGGAAAHGVEIGLTAQAPYPDIQARKLDGAVTARLEVASGRLEQSDRSLTDFGLAAAFNGRISGWISDLVLAGQADAVLSASDGRLGGAKAGAVKATASAPDLRWSREGGDRVAATVRMQGDLTTLTAGDLRLSSTSVAASGPVTAGPGTLTGRLTASVNGQGAWSGLGAPQAADAADLAALKRAARSFRIAAPQVSLAFDKSLTVALPKPLTVTAQGGGVVKLAARGRAPVFGPDGAALRLDVSGGGLPRVEADVARLTFAGGGVTAVGQVRARASMGLVQGGDVDASGRLTIADGAVAFTAMQCVTVAAQRLDFGANDIRDLSGRLCPAGGPLFRLSNGDWRLSARAADLTAAAPFLLAQVEGGAGKLTAASTRGALTATVKVEAARLRDTSAQARFNPLTLSGDVTLADYLWKADLAARLTGGALVGRANLAHDMGLGFGFVVLDTEILTFAEGGLQPAQISPLAAAIGPPVTGSARFKGRFDWASEGASSSGTLSLPGLNFQSAVGPVEGLKGEIAFTSLAPLVAAPGQDLEIARVAAVVPLTDLKARFGLADNLLRIEGGEAQTGGGRVRIENLEYPLVPGAPMRGLLIVEAVQLHDLVEASPFGDKVDFDAKVSGRLTFETTDGKVRITDGELKAIQPGRISIDRAALTGVQAEGAITTPVTAPEVVDPNATFTDFAYQAMEHLAFDTLNANVASREDGRLGVLFHIIGHHEPPQNQQIKLTIMDLISKRFLGRKLPLPSGTGVNLTLDTTLNLDDLLADYAEYQRARAGSGPVQP